MPIQAPKMIFVPLSEHRAPYTLWECDHIRLSLAGLLKTLSESFDSAQDERRSFDIIEDFSVHAEALEAFRNFLQRLASPCTAARLH